VYQWFVFTHLVGLVLFVFAHGASAFASYQIRSLRDPMAIGGYLTLSRQALGTSYVGLLVLIIGGAGAATVNNLFGEKYFNYAVRSQFVPDRYNAYPLPERNAFVTVEYALR